MFAEETELRHTPPRGYPYFEAKLRGGRLPVPPHLRRTPVGRLIERGSIGGTQVVEVERFEDTQEGREQLVSWARKHFGDRFAIEYIVDPRRSRITIPSSTLFQLDFKREGLPDYLKR